MVVLVFKGHRARDDDQGDIAPKGHLGPHEPRGEGPGKHPDQNNKHEVGEGFAAIMEKFLRKGLLPLPHCFFVDEFGIFFPAFHRLDDSAEVAAEEEGEDEREAHESDDRHD